MSAEQKTDFKSAMAELEEINLWFQGEDVDLDEGLTKLKRAKELIKLCKGKLKEVENEFSTLKQEIIEENTEVEYSPVSGTVNNDESLPF